MNRPASVVLVVTEDWFVASHWLPLIRGAVAAGYEVTVATRVQRHRGPIEAAGATVVPLGLARTGRDPIHELGSVLELIRLYRRLRPSIVHHIALKPVLYGSLAAFVTGPRPVINALPGLGYTFSGRSWRVGVFRGIVSTAYRFLLGREGTLALFENPDDRALLTERGIVRAEATAVIPGAGVDLEQFRPVPVPAGAPLVVLPARLLWDKGVGEFVEAARILRRNGSVARFAVVGGEDPANPAAIPPQVIEEWRREGTVEIRGHSTEMPTVLASAAVICLPSYREGLPKALSEAAASGRPIVATDVPGCREVVVHEVNGLLVPARDSGALAAALGRLLEDPELRARLGAAGRLRAVEMLGEERVIETFLGIYAAQLRRGGPEPESAPIHDRHIQNG